VSAVFAAAVFEAAVTLALGQVQTFKPVTDDRLRSLNPNDWLMLSRFARRPRQGSAAAGATLSGIEIIVLGGETNTHWFGGDFSYVVSASVDKWRYICFLSLYDRSRRFSRRIEERQFSRCRANFVAHRFDCDFHLKFCAGRSVLPADACERDHSFQ
jgi:hypothetical protein